jgi:epoxyqueuosine reductase
MTRPASDASSADALRSLAARLHATARRAGAAASGVSGVEPFDDVARSLRRRVATGQHARLGFTFTDPATATDVRRSFPWAERLFCVGWAYVPAAGSPGPPDGESARVARFATEDHYEGLWVALQAVATDLAADGHRAVPLADDHRLVDRAAAVRAGVGWWGKNTMVLAPGVGPWMLLGSVVTDAALPETPPMTRDCGSCQACLPACPTEALVAPGILDARRCLAALLQQPGMFPRHLRAAVGDRLYGCDDCLDACPPGSRLLDRGATRAGRHDVLEVLGAADQDLLRRFGHFYLPKRRPSILRRNALIVLGNLGGPDALAVAAGYLGHPDWVLRAHAAWVVGTVGGSDRVAVLTAAGADERHPEVQEEIRLALARN